MKHAGTRRNTWSPTCIEEAEASEQTFREKKPEAEGGDRLRGLRVPARVLSKDTTELFSKIIAEN